MQAMKLRLIAMGCILSVLGAALLIARGYRPELLGLLIAGIVLLVVGLVWPKPKAPDAPRKETK
jgi:NhaP-type Na+/H+ or K+/H+ antiporter